MFEVEHEDDAWELGVLKAHGFFDSPNGSQSAEELGVPSNLVEFFDAGCSDHNNLSDLRVESLALSWGLPLPDKLWRD